MTLDRPKHKSWIAAIREAADQEHVELPSITDHGMGSLSWRNDRGDRLVTFKRRLVPILEAEKNGIEWSLWYETNDLPSRVVSFRERLYPEAERVAFVLSVIKGWLLDQWTAENTKAVVLHSTSQNAEIPPTDRSDRNEYWLSEDRRIGLLLLPDCWRIRSQSGSLATWRSIQADTVGDGLSLASLDAFLRWLAENWKEIGHGMDHRPPSLQHRGVVASRAYENAQLDQTATTLEVRQWWEKHAIRASDEELPNLFLERQGDELVISWDANPSPNRFYRIYSGEEVVPVAFAVPVLRDLMITRLQSMSLQESERLRLLANVSSTITAGYAALSLYNPEFTSTWLNRHGFSDRDAEDVALLGTSRHPVVGLLRSGYGTSVAVPDYETILGMLRPSEEDSFQHLRSLAKGINTHVDVREPWESGYRLARLIRETLRIDPHGDLDIEQLLRDLKVDIRESKLSDPVIRGVCIGSPAYGPLVVINLHSPDANGPSGRRITLAHELCHLLFDRSRLRNLARFDWEMAENDRLLEMRANAFAVEILVPMDLLMGADGAVLDNQELGTISASRQVSLTALLWHAQNLRNRLLKR